MSSKHEGYHDGSILKIEASLAAVVVRIDALDEEVKKFWDHDWDHDGLASATKAFSGRVNQVEGRVVNGGVSNLGFSANTWISSREVHAAQGSRRELRGEAELARC